MKASAENLKQVVFERLERCRQDLQAGKVDMLGVQDSVRDYCDLLATLPRSEANAHKEDLQAMMRELGELGDTLKAERDAVRAQLDGLGKLKRASVAYQTSDAMGGKFTKKGSE